MRHQGPLVQSTGSSTYGESLGRVGGRYLQALYFPTIKGKAKCAACYEQRIQLMWEYENGPLPEQGKLRRSNAGASTDWWWALPQ